MVVVVVIGKVKTFLKEAAATPFRLQLFGVRQSWWLSCKLRQLSRLLSPDPLRKQWTQFRYWSTNQETDYAALVFRSNIANNFCFYNIFNCSTYTFFSIETRLLEGIPYTDNFYLLCIGISHSFYLFILDFTLVCFHNLGYFESNICIFYLIQL